MRGGAVIMGSARMRVASGVLSEQAITCCFHVQGSRFVYSSHRSEGGIPGDRTKKAILRLGDSYAPPAGA